MSEDSADKADTKLSKTVQSITGYGPIGSFGVACAAFLLPQVVAAVVLGLLSTTGWKFNDTNITQYFLLDLATEGLTLYLLLRFLRKRKRSFKDLYGSLKEKWQLLLVPIAFVLYLACVTFAYSIVQVLVRSVDLNQEQHNIFKSAVSHPEIALAFVALVIVTPIVEETVFRGFLYRGLKTRFSRLFAALLTSFIFATAHGQLNVGIDTFILSLFLIGLLEFTGSLIPSILLHALKNMMAFIIIFNGRF